MNIKKNINTNYSILYVKNIIGGEIKMTKFWIQGNVVINLSKAIEAKNIEEAWNIAEKKGISFFDLERDIVDCDDETFELNSVTLYKSDRDKNV